MIDWNRVEELRQDIGAESFAEVIDIFLEEVETALAGLSADSPAGGLAEELHFLKGSALNIGFSRLADLCAEGEHAAAAGDAEAVSLAQIHRCYAESKAHFLASDLLAAG